MTAILRVLGAPEPIRVVRRPFFTAWHWPILAAIVGAASARADELGLRLSPYSDAATSRPLPSESASVFGASVASILMLLAAGLVAGTVCLLVARLRWTRRALSHETNRYEQLAEQTSDVVLRILDGRATISSSIETLTGYSSAEMDELGMAALVHPDDLIDVVTAYKDVGADTLRRTITYRLLHKNGSTVWVEATFGWLCTTDGDGETIVTIRDITKRQIEAEALQGAIQAARAAREASEAANQTKSDFLASMSHEIRTPLNAIIGFADLQIAMPDLPPAAQRHAERIKGGGAALLMIVNDILDFAQAESGKLRLDPRPFALPLLVDECIALVGNAAVAKRLALNIELVDRFPAGLLGDEARLRQILLNLLNNAIKFTDRGSVTLRIGYGPKGGNRVVFAVTDTGIGIDAEHLPHLFQRFHQVDGTIRRNYGGTGLGLAISKMLVELMGGAIDVVSKKGIGSTFTVSVDLAPAPLVLDPGARQEPTGRPLSILLVEDMPINQELARAVLEAKGHVVDVVGDGAEAIMAVDTFVYDLVLMDVQMPFVDGLTATRAIRDLPNDHRLVPIVAMTANVMKDQIVAAMAAGMDDVLAKPLSIDAVQAMLAKVERDTLRPNPSAALDHKVFARLAEVIGEARAKTMLHTLVKTLLERFAQPLSPENLSALKADAHASATAAATLGFLPFAASCRNFVAATEGEAASAAYAILRGEHLRAVVMACRLANLPSVDERQAA